MKARKMIYDAVALAERFPDLPDIDVKEHIEYVYCVKLDENSVLWHAILLAYHTQNENLGLSLLR